MNILMEIWVKSVSSCRNMGKGQTTAEYAMILSVVAIAVWASYTLMGNDLGFMVHDLGIKISAAT